MTRMNNLFVSIHNFNHMDTKNDLVKSILSDHHDVASSFSFCIFFFLYLPAPNSFSQMNVLLHKYTHMNNDAHKFKISIVYKYPP